MDALQLPNRFFYYIGDIIGLLEAVNILPLSLMEDFGELEMMSRQIEI